MSKCFILEEACEKIKALWQKQIDNEIKAIYKEVYGIEIKDDE